MIPATLRTARFLATGTVLRLALIPLLVGSLALAGYALFDGRLTTLGVWDTLGAAPLMTGPIVAAAAAWLQWRDGSVLADAFAGSQARQRRAAWARGLALLGMATATHLMAVLALILTLVVKGRFTLRPLDWTLPLSPVGVLAGCVGVGLIMGSLIRSALAPAVAAVATFLLPMVAVASGNTTLWISGGSTGLTADVVPRVEVVAAQVAIGGSLLALGATVGASASPVRAFIGLRPVIPLVCALASAAFLVVTPNSRFTPDDAALTVECVGEAPMVCLTAEHATAQAGIAKVVQLVNALKSPTSPVPVTVVREVSVGQFSRHGTRAATNERWLPTSELRSPEPFILAEYIATPTRCAAELGTWPRELWTDAAMAFRQWVAEEVSAPGGPHPGHPLARLSKAQRAAWLDAAWSSLDRCSSPPSLP